MARQARRPRRHRPGPEDRTADRRDHSDHVDRLCGSDLHLYEVLGPFLGAGDILGHEPMGIVEAVGSEVTNIGVGDRVVVPFNISCGHCFMCGQGLQSQCETTQVREQGIGCRAVRLHEALRRRCRVDRRSTCGCRRRSTARSRCPEGPPDDRFLYLSDVLPTAWQAVAVRRRFPTAAASPCSASADRRHGHPHRHAPGASQVFGVDLVPERLRASAGERGRRRSTCREQRRRRRCRPRG